MIQIKSDQKMIFDIFLIKNNQGNVQKLYIEVLRENISQLKAGCEIKRPAFFRLALIFFLISVTLPRSAEALRRRCGVPASFSLTVLR
jgi:hypothetical protein